MNLNISKTIKNIGQSIGKHSPEILVGFGVVGMISSIGLAIQETPKALEIIKLEEARREEHDFEIESDADDIDAVPVKDVIRLTWKCYIPCMVTTAASIACFIGANSIHCKRNAVLATAYKIAETSLYSYKDELIENLGKGKAQEITSGISKKIIDKNPVDDNEIIFTDKGNTLCYDNISDRYFRSDIDFIKRSVNRMNRKMLECHYVSLNEFYELIGLSKSKLGSSLGWNDSEELIRMDFSSQLAKNGEPCLVLDYIVAPKYDYRHY